MPVFTHLRRLLISCLALAWLIAPAPASAQGNQDGREVEISVPFFGVGNASRAGDWAGLFVLVKDLGDQPTREVSVRLHMTDPDGDTALYERVFTLTLGQPSGVWLYTTMPWSLAPSDAFTITVNEADTSGTTTRIGRQIGYERVSPQRVVEPERPMIGVVGRETHGLLQYEESGRDQNAAITSHELTRIIHGITVGEGSNELPTEWMGLAPFETIVWTEGDPNSIQYTRNAEAIREWVNRGGHLVIVMEPVGDGWFTATNQLADLLPKVTVSRHEEVDLERYRSLLSTPTEQFGSLPLPSSAVVHSFAPRDNPARGEAISLVRGPHGTVVTRRLIGSGMVTVVGIDLSAGGMGRRGLVRADAFWNRILGRRADTLTPTQVDALSRSVFSSVMRGRGNTNADRYVSEEINLTGTVSVGVLFGLGLFSVYWLVAGFGSFAGLKARKLEHHAWTVFVLVIVLFTGIAWAGAKLLRPTDVRALHVTFLDHVYGQPVDRARAFISIMLPEYGSQTVSIPAQTDDEPWRQTLSPWADPKDAGTQNSFPDAREYTVEARRPDSFTVPARQTVKQFRADWLGAPGWVMPIPPGEGEQPRTLGDGTVDGTLSHDLPSALDEVVIFHILGQRTPDEVEADREKKKTGVIPFETRAVKLRTPWEAGVAIDLSDLFDQVAESTGTGVGFLDNLVPRKRAGSVVIGDRGGPGDYNLITYHGVIGEPEYESQSIDSAFRSIVQRRLTHTLSISEYFASPCVIITGLINDSPSPVPFDLDGRPVQTNGRTIVRWIYPLDDKPLRVSDTPRAETDSE